ncbi:MAG TPA: branched-chain amino acid ABC transporter permease [Acidimicrobiales bacterium]|nr:branched-chain amino acid ABC transporter permease [Acidimicrobiales bacterium]
MRRSSAAGLPVLAVLAVVPVWIGGRHGYGLGTTAVIAVITALGLQVVYGLSGQLSVAQAPLQGVGAYAVAQLMVAHGWSFWAALLPAVAVAALFGVVVGLPGLRVRGDVLALATLGAGEILQSLFLNTERFTGGYQGIAAVPGVSVFGHALDDRGLYAVALVVALVVLAAAVALKASPLGRACMALRDDEVAARSFGVHPGRLRLLAFAVGSGMAGAAGGLYAVQNGFVSSVSFGLSQTVVVILIVLIAGEARMGRTVVAAVAMTAVLDRLAAYGDVSEAVTGLVILLVAATRLGLGDAARARLRTTVRLPALRRPVPAGGVAGR